MKEDVIMVSKNSVACNGGNGPLGHPKVYLDVGKTGKVTCPYCSQEFVYSKESS